MLLGSEALAARPTARWTAGLAAFVCVAHCVPVRSALNFRHRHRRIVAFRVFVSNVLNILNSLQVCLWCRLPAAGSTTSGKHAPLVARNYTSLASHLRQQIIWII